MSTVDGNPTISRAEPAPGSPRIISARVDNTIVNQNKKIVKPIFDLVRDSLTWSGHKLQGQKITPEQQSLLIGRNSRSYTADGCIMGNPHDYTIAKDEENVKSVLALLWLNQEIKLSL